MLYVRRAATRSRLNDVDEWNSAGLRGLVAGGGFDGFFEVGGDAGFGDVGADAGLCGVAGEVEGFEVGDDEDFGVGGVAADEFGGGEAVHGGHGDVEEDYVGLQLGGFGYGVVAVIGFAADGPVVVKLEEQFQAGSDGGAVVGDEDADWRHAMVGSFLVCGVWARHRWRTEVRRYEKRNAFAVRSTEVLYWWRGEMHIGCSV